MQLGVPRGLVALAALLGALVVLTPASGGAFTGANGKLAYTCGTHICTINPDGSGAATLTALPSGASDPSWSDDGTQLAFATQANGVSVANADGTGIVQLGAGVGTSEPTFSPSDDSLRVAYARNPGIWSILASGHGAETHLTTDASDQDPQYSPDGSEIAFARNDGATGYDIWVVDVVDDTLTQITAAAGDERNPTWSPDGNDIAYASSSGHLFQVSSDAVQSTTPLDLGVAGTEPAYSPDGTKIAFVDGNQLKYMVATQNGAVTAIPNTTGATQPDWQSATPQVSPPPVSGPPVNTLYPTINLPTGDTQPVVGHFLTAGVGTWSGTAPFNFTYQWKRCDASDPLNGSCVNIPGATSSFYTVANADAGSRLRVQVTATNAQGTASQNSESSAIVVAIAPKVTVTPQISDDSPVVDTPLNLSAGTWTGSTPIAFTYSWRRCNPVGDPDSCVPIPGATTTTYTPTLADIGFSLRVWIVGANPAGTDTAITNHTFPVVDKPHFSPTVETAPAVAGTTYVGRQLTADIGTFSGDEPITTSFVWQRCDATGAACQTITNAKKVTYFPTSVDVGYTIRVSVTATNAYGKMVTQSDPTEAVAATPPHLKGKRIVGTNKGEYLAGGGHDDVIYGEGGNDTLLGGAGDDKIYGGAGNDVITGGSGADQLDGGPGSDTIYANDGERDTIDCGPGRDRAVVDSFDKTANCEVVVIAAPPT